MRNLFFNIPIDVLSKDEALFECLKILNGHECRHLLFINAHCYNVAQQNQRYREAIHHADLILNDGIGMKMASLFSKVRFKENLNGTDFIPMLIEKAADSGKKIYILGGKKGIVETAKAQLELQKPGINIVGCHHGFFSFKELDVIHDINASGAELLIVGMGVPLQEMWIDTMRNHLKTVRLCVAGGAIVDFISGNVPRAPFWVRKMNMEWFFRLIIEPGRMWRRYLVGNFQFFYYIFLNAFKKQSLKSYN